jgi:hypothetical protein
MVGASLSRMTVTDAVVAFPTLSVAVTSSVFTPLARLTAPTDHVAVPVADPLALFVVLTQVTDETPAGSVAVPFIAVAVSAVSELFVGLAICNVGPVTSRVTTTVALPVSLFAFVAVTTIVFDPMAKGIVATDQEVVPVALPLAAVVVLDHVTDVMPVVSVEVPVSAIDAAEVSAVGPAGVVIATAGPGAASVVTLAGA